MTHIALRLITAQFTSCDMTTGQDTTSHRIITWHYKTWHYKTWHDNSQPTTLPFLTSLHNQTHDVIPHHITSHHVTAQNTTAEYRTAHLHHRHGNATNHHRNPSTRQTAGAHKKFSWGSVLVGGQAHILYVFFWLIGFFFPWHFRPRLAREPLELEIGSMEVRSMQLPALKLMSCASKDDDLRRAQVTILQPQKELQQAIVVVSIFDLG